MKVKELKILLENCDEDATVAVGYLDRHGKKTNRSSEVVEAGVEPDSNRLLLDVL